MIQGWEIKKLGEVCYFERGLTYAKGDEVATSSKGVLRSNNIDLITNSLNYDEIKYLREDFEIPTKKMVRKNSLLMCISNGSKIHLGKVALIEDDIDYAFGGFMGLLTPNEAIIHPRYFYYALISPAYKMMIQGLSDGANINNLKFADLQSFDIPIPPLAEQERIVEILDSEFEKIDALKANAERNLQYAKDLYAKLTDHILTPQEGWSTSNLKSICKKIGSGATPSGGKQSYTDKGIHLIRSMNVHNNCFRYNELAHINDVQAKQLDNVTIERGDVLFNITGASVTRCCLVPVDVIPARVNQHVSILRVDDNIILPKYLVYTLISSRYNVPLMQMAEDGATRQAITKKQLEDFNISYPNTIKEQLNIISFLDKLSEQCKALGENYTNTIALCDDMKQALLRQAFNGEL